MLSERSTTNRTVTRSLGCRSCGSARASDRQMTPAPRRPTAIQGRGSERLRRGALSKKNSGTSKEQQQPPRMEDHQSAQIVAHLQETRPGRVEPQTAGAEQRQDRDSITERWPPGATQCEKDNKADEKREGGDEQPPTPARQQGQSTDARHGDSMPSTSRDVNPRTFRRRGRPSAASNVRAMPSSRDGHQFAARKSRSEPIRCRSMRESQAFDAWFAPCHCGGRADPSQGQIRCADRLCHSVGTLAVARAWHVQFLLE